MFVTFYGNLEREFWMISEKFEISLICECEKITSSNTQSRISVDITVYNFKKQKEKIAKIISKLLAIYNTK